MSTPEFEDQLVGLSEWRNQHFFGKYRGTVDTVEEGDDLGIISVKVPDVFGADFVVERVRPCSPFAGSKHGFVAIPESGDGVWVEFEAGKPSLPIWTGFWWADGEMPEPKGPLVRSFITTAGHKLILDDDAGEVTLLHSGGAEMTMTDSDITIKIGGDSGSSIKLTSSDITLQVGASPTSPSIKITSSDITIQSSTVGSVKLTSGGVDIGNGAMKIGA
jgi:hypothetical protein